MIHPSAIVHPRAKLGENVSIGAYSLVGEHVEVGGDTWIGPHVVVEGHTRIGRNNRIFQFSSLGAVPQDKKYSDEPTRLEIGDGNTIREFCTLNCGTAQDAGVTRVGDDNWIMAYVHIAHDCQIGSHAIFANSAQLAGHVHIGDYAILGGFTGVHQFVRVGAHSFAAIAISKNTSLVSVAPGIAEALFATAIGLVAAIPAVMAYNYFTRRIRVLRSEMETFEQDYLNIIKRHFLR